MVVSLEMRKYLRGRAGWVWNEQARAFYYGLSLQEETLTELLLLRMARDHATHGLHVRMFTKDEEKRNGADWEWVIRTRDCEFDLRIQAKRLYHKNSKKDYGGLDPKSGQTDKLISQAADCIPIYIFFNHDFGMHSSLFMLGGEAPFRGPSFWGCSIASAQSVKAANSNKLQDLKSVMKPWHRLITDAGNCGLQTALGATPNNSGDGLSSYRRTAIERIGDPDFMSEYTAENQLAGFAVLDFTDFEGD